MEGSEDPRAILSLDIVQRQVFTPKMIGDLCMTLIQKYLVLQKDELEEWQKDPEEFVQEQELDNWSEAFKVSSSRAGFLPSLLINSENTAF